MLFFTYLRYIYPVDGYSAVYRLNNPDGKPHLNLVSGSIQNTRIRVRENAARMTDYKTFGHLLVSLNIINL